VAARFPSARFTQDLSELLEDPAARCGRPRHARPDARRARETVLKAGKHCFVEKPLRQTVADAERAVAAAAERRPDR
jgi:predicted dehydrogenase